MIGDITYRTTKEGTNSVEITEHYSISSDDINTARTLSMLLKICDKLDIEIDFI